MPALEPCACQDYRKRLEKARSLSIPDREKEVLVALYSVGDRVDLTDVFTRDTAVLEETVASLESKELVTADTLSETELTAKGRLVVSDRFDEVND
jgi:helix-turn-helix protein